MSQIEDRSERMLLADARDVSPGLFAWGLPRLGARRLAISWFEFTLVFVIPPVSMVFIGAKTALPLIVIVMLCTAAILLSMTRSFHWSDLWPVDMLSEWRIALQVVIGFAAASFLITTLAFPDMLLAAPGDVYLMLIAYPIATALPIELVFRALFFRRFGHLFSSEATALTAGAATNALAFLLLSSSVGGMIFGAVIGAALGHVYLRTGQFILCVLLHWAAAICVWSIGPGLAAF